MHFPNLSKRAICFATTLVWLILQLAHAVNSVEGIQVYQNNIHLLPEHKQKLVEDITLYRNADNLWDILRDEFSLRHFEESYAVQNKIDWYMRNQDYLLRVASRAAPYLYYISQQVRKRHLPAELVLLPIVESAYDPFSVSSVGASGIWQLMPGTAMSLGVKQDLLYDGRRDIIASTRAALNYLAYLQSFFEGNWLLAIAAYNTGEGNVLSAIKRNIREGRDTEFWSLPLARETRDYVPSLLALAAIISRPDKYPVYLPPIRNAPYLAQIDVGKKMDVKIAAKLAGITLKHFSQLNPGVTGSSIARGNAFKLVLPIENVEKFTENLARYAITPTINWSHYKVKPGDTLVSLARKFQISPSEIRKMNHLSKLTIKPGMNLLIPDEGKTENIDKEDTTFKPEVVIAKRKIKNKPKTKYVAQKSLNKNYNLKPGDTIYMVKKSDTLTKIAKRFNIPVKTIRTINQLTNTQLAIGKQIVVPTGQPKSAPSGFKMIKPGDTVYMVRKGDTIEKIARRFKTTASAIRISNLIDNTSLIEGERIIIPTHVRS